ncbi:hypothetical protein B0H63DRAFT_552721 [Podospora didyma]|uniref:Aminoglycoside phosphotransferase domain-containing protein n=1 Tax=Podospora didyma TaxID=330526 RepID=A0AAE0N539_9PEZI|nr:hypothetical protein B0H63DRAFT_552721 [Podospora didyma]
MSWGRDFRPHDLDLYDIRTSENLLCSMGDKKIWRVDEKSILKETPYREGDIEAATLDFVRRRTGIPVPVLHGTWCENRSRFILQRRHIATQVNGFLEELQSVTQTSIKDTVPKWNSMAEFNVGMRWVLEDAGVSREICKIMYAARPGPTTDTGPQFSLCHGDLSAVNIMVDPATATVTGIIDWEYGGFYPSWFEFARLSLSHTAQDREWKAILSELMETPTNTYGKDWWLHVVNLSRTQEAFSLKTL